VSRPTHPTSTTVTLAQIPPTSTAPTSQLFDVAFLSPSVGYGLFLDTDGTQCSERVGTTVNGGTTFGALHTVTAGLCSQLQGSTSLAADDHGDVFAYGDALFVSHDNAVTWTAVSQPGVVLSVQALGSSIWLAGSSCGPNSAGNLGCAVHLSVSGDGGRTWSARPVPAHVVTSGPEGAIMVRTGQNDAYLGAAPPLESPTGPVPLWYTDDGGQTWANRQIPCGAGPFTVALSAAPDGTLIALCAFEPSAGYQQKTSLRSTDGGQSWSTEFFCPPAPTGADATACDSDPLSFGYLGSVDAVSATTAFMVGGRASLTETADGGATWHVIKPLIGSTADGTFNVVFFNADAGLVFGNDDTAPAIWHTSDGGVSWTKVLPVTTGGT
jgi:photosystem II stability/assembly factor-like uncharacterized protein